MAFKFTLFNKSPSQPPPAQAQPQPWVPLGHYYSPIVDVHELEKRRHQVFDRSIAPSGIDLREEYQLQLLNKLKPHYDRLEFTPAPKEGFRYHYDNNAFSYADGIILACMLMELRPRRLIEFGCGYSSCVTLDINEKIFNWSIDCTFIDPYPDAFLRLVKPGDVECIKVLKEPAQDIDLGIIDQLEAGDILFIDSTHVSKAGSDVNFHVFKVLPRLKSGVMIHFHDIFYPFEYPESWFFNENRSWNEIYLLRAFLTDNPKYEIELFNHFIGLKHRQKVDELMPLFGRNIGGSLWLRKK